MVEVFALVVHFVNPTFDFGRFNGHVYFKPVHWNFQWGKLAFSKGSPFGSKLLNNAGNFGGGSLPRFNGTFPVQHLSGFEPGNNVFNHWQLNGVNQFAKLFEHVLLNGVASQNQRRLIAIEKQLSHFIVVVAHVGFKFHNSTFFRFHNFERGFGFGFFGQSINLFFKSDVFVGCFIGG